MKTKFLSCTKGVDLHITDVKRGYLSPFLHVLYQAIGCGIGNGLADVFHLELAEDITAVEFEFPQLGLSSHYPLRPVRSNL